MLSFLYSLTHIHTWPLEKPQLQGLSLKTLLFPIHVPCSVQDILGQISLPLGYLMQILTFRMQWSFTYFCNNIFNLCDYFVTSYLPHQIVLGLRKWMFCALYYFSIGHRIWDLETLLWIVSEWMSWILDSGIIVPTQDPGRLSQVQCDFYHIYLPSPPSLNK